MDDEAASFAALSTAANSLTKYSYAGQLHLQLKRSRLVAVLVCGALLAGCNSKAGNGEAQGRVSSHDVADIPTGAVPVLPPGVLTNEPLRAFAQAKMDHPPMDQFSQELDDSALAGRRFSLQFSQPGDIPASGQYDIDRKLLTIRVFADDLNDFDTWYGFVPISKTTKEGDAVLMSNAYGVSKGVTPEDVTELGVGAKASRLGVFKAPFLTPDFLVKEIRVEPDEARTIADHLTVTFDGSISKGVGGHTITCFENKQEASMTNTNPTDTHACIIHGHLDKVVVSSPSMGVVAT